MTQILKRIGVRRDRGDGELTRLKTELANVTTALEASVSGLETLSSDTTRLYESVQRFARDFHSLYPSEDGVRRLGASTVESTTRLEVSASPCEMRVMELERGVRAYLAEIRNLQSELVKVTAKKRDVDLVTRRAERLESRRQRTDDNRSVIARKLADEKTQTYNRLVDALRNRLISTHEKHARVFQQVYTAYMLRLHGNLSVFDRFTRPHRLHAIKLDKLAAMKNFSNSFLVKQQSWHAGDGAV